MKKYLAIVLALIMVLAALTGCGSEPAKTPENDGTVANDDGNVAAGGQSYEGIPLTDEDITLVVWESTAGADEFIIQAGKAFTAKYPNIKIEFVNVELGDSSGQIALDGPAGVGPDLFASPNNTAGTLVSSGLILESPAQDYLKEKLSAGAQTAITYSGNMYGVPIASEGYAVFYNRALISDEEVPATFEELVEWTEKFNVENPGKSGFLMNVAEGYYTITFCTQTPDKRIFGEYGDDPTVTHLNDEANVKTFAWMVENLRPVMDFASADIDQSTLQDRFVKGNAAMFVTGLWDVSVFQDAGIDFGVATFPTLPGTNVIPEVFSSARVMYTSAFSTHVNEANAFALFLVSDEMQQLRYEICGSAPTTAVEVESDYITGFAKQMGYSYPCPVLPEFNAFWDAMNNASANIWDCTETGDALIDFIQKELDAADNAIVNQN